MEKSVGFY